MVVCTRNATMLVVFLAVVLIERWTRRPREPLLALPSVERELATAKSEALRPTRGRIEPTQLWSLPSMRSSAFHLLNTLECQLCSHTCSCRSIHNRYKRALSKAGPFTREEVSTRSTEYWNYPDHHLAILHRHKHVSCTTITPQPIYSKGSTNLAN